jgi:hypothetical protein
MNTHPSDHELIVHLRQTLDSAAHQPNDFDAVLSDLGKKAALTRQQKLRQAFSRKTKGWVVGGMVVAASLTLTVLPTIFTNNQQQAAITAAQTLNNLTVANVDPQLLEDLEMVSALEDDHGNN